jgi:hypothetical protein
MAISTFQNEDIFGEFSNHPNKTGFVTLDCKFDKEVSVECFVQDGKGRIQKKLSFKANSDTKTFELDMNGLASNLIQVWFYVEGSTYFREIRFLEEKQELNESKLGRFFKLFS